MAKEKNKQWYYVWMKGCGPCTKISPILDGMIACGLDIKKIEHPDYVAQFPQTPVRGTPSIVCIEGTKIVDQIGANILSPLIDLTSSAPEVLNTTAGEYLYNKINNK